MTGRRSPRFLPARARAFAAATLALAAVLIGLGVTPVAASTTPVKESVRVSPAFAADPAVSAAVVTTLSDSLSMANEVLTAIRPMTLVGFKPGNIMSDSVFYNKNSMTEAQIQEFLNSKVPRCQSGYVCLRNFKQNTAARAASALCSAYTPANNESAARIIFRVAHACGINPQVILVTLQKEQGLVTHSDPSEFRYTIAMGQGCPDTAACDTAYYGFFNQVYGAAAQFKRYSNPPGTSNYFNWYAPGKAWNVGFHPNAACGSTPVYIENQATANLYYYTPYQPNPAAIAAGYAAANDGCSSYGNRNFYNYFTDWFGSTQVPRGANLIGNFEVLESVPGEFRVVGWALDPGRADSLDVHVYVDGQGYALHAAAVRPDVGAAYPVAGAAHGFDLRVPNNGPGASNVCVYAISLSAAPNKTLGCRTATAMSGSPFGNFETARGIAGGVSVVGWVIDPDTVGDVSVHLYVGGVGTAIKAAERRDDVGRAFPGYGATHGFNATITAASGRHEVCAYGINVGAGGNALLGCKTIDVPAPSDQGRAPIGSLEVDTISENVVKLRGWAIDFDAAAKPIQIRVEVNGTSTNYAANTSRPDVARHYPEYGPNHGFEISIKVPYGKSDICVTALNDTAIGGDTALGCRSYDVPVPPPSPEDNRDPIGFIDGITPVPDGASITGWTLDPDTPEPIDIHVYVDGVGSSYTANKSRPDVAAAYPAFGEFHGYSEVVPMTPGSRWVCVYAMNASGGNNPTLGCGTVVIP